HRLQWELPENTNKLCHRCGKLGCAPTACPLNNSRVDRSRSQSKDHSNSRHRNRSASGSGWNNNNTNSTSSPNSLNPNNSTQSAQ
ncbi:hypothetical protein RhiirB3_461735, partial [Rhizophagus irregularis]